MLPFFFLFSEIKICFTTFPHIFIFFGQFSLDVLFKKGKRTVGMGGSCKVNHGNKNVDIQFCKLLFKITVTIKFTFNLMIKYSENMTLPNNDKKIQIYMTLSVVKKGAFDD